MTSKLLLVQDGGLKIRINLSTQKNKKHSVEVLGTKSIIGFKTGRRKNSGKKKGFNEFQE